MLEGASLLLSHFGWSLLYAAQPRRLPKALARRGRAWSWGCGVGAAVALALAWLAWASVDGPAAATLVLLCSSMVSASLVVVLAPVLQRWVWLFALAAPAFAAALVLCRGLVSGG